MHSKRKSSIISGIVSAPPSKSMAQRAIAAASLASGTSKIYFDTPSDDIEASLRIIKSLGAQISVELPGHVTITGGKVPKELVIDCGESGLSMRMFSSLAALHSVPLKLTGHGSLETRPMTAVKEILSQLGALIGLNGQLPPISIHGPIKPGKIEVDGSLSSQFLTGLLIALPTLSGNSEISVINLKSKPYIEMTLELIADFGIKIDYDTDLSHFSVPGNQTYQASQYWVEGDWSGASFLIVAGAIGGNVTITNLKKFSKQADKKILDAVRDFGARVEFNDTSLTIKSELFKPFNFDATECPDLFPPLVALASKASGVSRIKGVHRLKHKESDRENSLTVEFSKLGIKLTTDDDELVVSGGEVCGAKVFSHHDHRIAMALAVAGLTALSPVEIEHPECVAKSYPEFYEDLARLTAD